MEENDLQAFDLRRDLLREYELEKETSYDEYAEWEALDNPNDRLSPNERGRHE